MKKRKNIQLDLLRAIRARNRAEEIKAFGHSVRQTRVQKSKKIYDRKNTPATRYGEDDDGV